MPRPKKPPFAPQALARIGKLHMAPEVEREASAAALDLLAHVRTMIANGGHNMAFGRMVGLLKVLTPYVIKQSGAGLEPEETNEPMTLDTLITSLQGMNDQDKAKVAQALAPKPRLIEPQVIEQDVFDPKEEMTAGQAASFISRSIGSNAEHNGACACWQCKVKDMEAKRG